jgi:hypothetical protein
MRNPGSLPASARSTQVHGASPEGTVAPSWEGG